MMKKHGLALLLALWALAPAHAQNAGWPPPAGAMAMLGVYNATPPVLTDGQIGFVQVDAAGNLQVVGTFTPSTSSANFTPVAAGAATATKGTLLGIQYDTTQKTLTNGQQAALSASARGAAFIAKGADGFSIDNTTFGATLPAAGTIAAGNGVVPASSSEAGAGTSTTASSALAANLVVKASAGNLYGFQVSADSTLSGAAWWIMVYNATAAPGEGAVTPAKCYAMPSGTTAFSASWPLPVQFSTGITIGVSTTGCFTKTASTHAFISGDYK